MDCNELAEAAPELALEMLTGRERAAALAHLEGCESCRKRVSALAADTDLLLLLAPPAEPPPGFAQRVVGSIAQQAAPPAARPQPRPHRRIVAGLAVAACLVFAALILGVGRSTSPALATADMRTPSGDVVGQVVLHPEPSAALFLTMPGWAEQIDRYAEPTDTFSLRVGRAGETPRVMPLDIGADTTWAATLDIDPQTISHVAIVDRQGDVWCEADI